VSCAPVALSPGCELNPSVTLLSGRSGDNNIDDKLSF
jgi:hypothetical protein